MESSVDNSRMTAEVNQETRTSSDTDTLTDISRSVDFGDLGPIQRLLNIP